jgi:hypothetical protein
LDAFNIFDLFVEVWKTVKWLFVGVILRRPYVRSPEDGRFDIYDAVNGKRDVGVYGTHDTYAMLDIPSERNGASGNFVADDEGVPSSLMPGKKLRDEDMDIVEQEAVSPELKPEEYSNTYGADNKV